MTTILIVMLEFNDANDDDTDGSDDDDDEYRDDDHDHDDGLDELF
jgi:hypothetical protein